MFCAPRYPINEILLDRCVQVLVLEHVGQLPLLQQAGEHLAHTGCKGNGYGG